MSELTPFDVIVRPIYFSAKAHGLAAERQYTFEVHSKATKIQIKSAIESLYEKDKVVVESVNVLWTKSKEKRRGTRRGRVVGRTSAWKKAVVTLAPGSKISGLYEEA
jgi:large subunit ribosomal protein L23